MQRGSMIIYDNVGNIFVNTGDAEGDISPNIIPVGLPYIETQFGELNGKRVLSVDVATKTLIMENIQVQPSYSDLENQLLIAQEGLL